VWWRWRQFVICSLLDGDNLSGNKMMMKKNIADFDPLDIHNIDRDLVVHQFATSTDATDLFRYSLVLNKFNTVTDHVRNENPYNYGI
jgi:hypothetical protein